MLDTKQNNWFLDLSSTLGVTSSLRLTGIPYIHIEYRASCGKVRACSPHDPHDPQWSTHFLLLAGGPYTAPGRASRKDQMPRKLKLAIFCRDNWQTHS